MYAVSDEYLAKIAGRAGVQYEYHGTITVGGTIYNFTQSDLKAGGNCLTRDIATGDAFEIGSTCSAELKLNFFLNTDGEKWYLDEKEVDRYTFRDAIVKLTFRLYLDYGLYEDVPCGVYTVSDVTRTANTLAIVAYDNMLKFNKRLSSPEDRKPYDWFVKACEECGVELATTEDEISSMPNARYITSGNDTSNTVTTWRDLIGYVSQFICAYCMIDREGRLVVRQYSMDITRTVGSGWRYSSEIADYESYYSEAYIKSTKMGNTVDIKSDGVDGGLVLNLGENPMIQYANTYAIERRVKEIIDALSKIVYTPFTVSTPADPSLDVGDILEFTDGQAVSGKVCAITTIELTINGKMTIKGVGKNPYSDDTTNPIEKKFEEMTSSHTDSLARYTDFVNEVDIEIGDGKEALIMSFPFEAGEDTHVDFHGEVVYTLSTTEIVTDDAYTETDAELWVSYYKNGNLVKEYHPADTQQDGTKLLNLLYFWEQQISQLDGSFAVWLKVTGGSLFIPKGYSRGYICSQGFEITEQEPRQCIYIEVTTNPDKMEYYAGEKITYNGMVVTAFFDDDTQEVVTDACTITPVAGTLAPPDGIDAIIQYVRDGELFDTELFIPVHILTRIEVTTNPDKMEYYAGETADYSGMVVTAFYDDNKSMVVTEDCEISPASGSVVPDDGLDVEIQYDTGYDVLEAALFIPVHALTRIEVTTQPDKTEYYAGETVDYTGMVVTAFYDNDVELVVTDDCEISPVSGTVVPDDGLNITIQYTARTEVLQAELFIPVHVLTKIEVTSNPDRMEYYSGDTVDYSGMVVTAFYDNDVIIEVTEDCTVTPASGSIVPDDGLDVLIQYTTSYDTFETELVIPVHVITRIEVTAEPEKTAYRVGENIDLSGIVVTAYYDNNVSMIVTDDCAYQPANGATITSSNDYEVTITYSADIDTVLVLEEIYPTDLYVATMPDKIAYKQGEASDYTGIVVKYKYSDETEDVVTDSCTFSPASGTRFADYGTESITVAYGEYDTFFNVDVVMAGLASLEVTSPPTKTGWFVGDTVDYTGLVVTATFDDETTQDVTEECVITPADGSTAAEKGDITVSVMYGGLTATFELHITKLGELNLRYVIYLERQKDKIIEIYGLNVENILDDGLDDLYIPDIYIDNKNNIWNIQLTNRQIR